MNPWRYAVYWAPPPGHPLWQAGCRWLGRDPAQPGAVWDTREATAAPRRYGFHATLVAPMRLREGAEAAAFLDSVGESAARLPRFTMPALEVRWLSDFLALCPGEMPAADHPLRRLGDTLVRELDPWRAPLGEAQIRQRLDSAALDAQQQALLRRWGYPHVFGRWRFHMTLSDSLPPEAAAARERIEREARAFFAEALAPALPCDSVCVFTEAEPGAPFVLTHRFALAA